MSSIMVCVQPTNPGDESENCVIPYKPGQTVREFLTFAQKTLKEDNVIPEGSEDYDFIVNGKKARLLGSTCLENYPNHFQFYMPNKKMDWKAWVDECESSQAKSSPSIPKRENEVNYNDSRNITLNSNDSNNSSHQIEIESFPPNPTKDLYQFSQQINFEHNLRNEKQAYEWQINAIKRASAGNLVLIAPTGSGKTRTAVHLAELMFQHKPKDLKVAVLCPTCGLADQHCNSFTEVRFRTAKVYGGAFYTDEYEVLVSTYGYFEKNLMDNLESFDLLVIDECHHAVRKDSSAVILRKYHELREQNKSIPKLLGLTASPPGNKTQEWKDLLWSEIHEPEIDRNLAKIVPVEFNSDDLEHYWQIWNIEAQLIEHMVTKFSLDENTKQKLENVPEELLNNQNLPRYLVLALQNLRTISYSILDPDIVSDSSDLEEDLAVWITDANTILSHYDFPTLDLNGCLSLKNSKNQKYPVLKSIITEQLEKNNDALILIFIDRRFLAKKLCEKLKEDKELKNLISVDYVTGTKMKPRKRQEAINKFKSLRTNVLVSTPALEEGNDFPNCSVVIDYNAPNNCVSLIQKRGRARKDDSIYYMFYLKNSPESKKIQNLQKDLSSDWEHLNTNDLNIRSDLSKQNNPSPKKPDPASPQKNNDNQTDSARPVPNQLNPVDTGRTRNDILEDSQFSQQVYQRYIESEGLNSSTPELRQTLGEQFKYSSHCPLLDQKIHGSPCNDKSKALDSFWQQLLSTLLDSPKHRYKVQPLIDKMLRSQPDHSGIQDELFSASSSTIDGNSPHKIRDESELKHYENPDIAKQILIKTLEEFGEHPVKESKTQRGIEVTIGPYTYQGYGITENEARKDAFSKALRELFQAHDELILPDHLNRSEIENNEINIIHNVDEDGIDHDNITETCNNNDNDNENDDTRNVSTENIIGGIDLTDFNFPLYNEKLQKEFLPEKMPQYEKIDDYCDYSIPHEPKYVYRCTLEEYNISKLGRGGSKKKAKTQALYGVLKALGWV